MREDLNKLLDVVLKVLVLLGVGVVLAGNSLDTIVVQNCFFSSQSRVVLIYSYVVVSVVEISVTFIKSWHFTKLKTHNTNKNTTFFILFVFYAVFIKVSQNNANFKSNHSHCFSIQFVSIVR